MSTLVTYRTTWTPFDAEMRDAMLRPTPGPVYYDGPECDAFEREMAAYLGTRHAVATSSGTTALYVAMRALGIGPGDEVIVPANGYLSAAECTITVGARPVYSDVLDATANMDVETIEPHVSARTKAIIVIHTYGHAVDMDPLMAMARRRGICVIEDAAHALGGEYRGRRLGSIGDVGFASFARKCVTVAGQGGMAFTNDARWAERMTRLRRHGWDRGDPYRGDVAVVGLNCVMNECQAAVGRVSLSRLDRHNQARAVNAKRYADGIRERALPVRPFTVMPWARHGWLHYVVQAPRRDDLLTFLKGRGVECAIHYRHPVYRAPTYLEATRDDPGPRPITDRLAEEIITLPSHPDMGDGIDVVLDEMASFYEHR